MKADVWNIVTISFFAILYNGKTLMPKTVVKYYQFTILYQEYFPLHYEDYECHSKRNNFLLLFPFVHCLFIASEENLHR